MTEILIFLLGLAAGGVVTYLTVTFRSGRGYFRVTKIPDEEDLYTVNVRLEPNQELQKKHRILLRREYSPR